MVASLCLSVCDAWLWFGTGEVVFADGVVDAVLAEAVFVVVAEAVFVVVAEAVFVPLCR